MLCSRSGGGGIVSVSSIRLRVRLLVLLLHEFVFVSVFESLYMISMSVWLVEW